MSLVDPSFLEYVVALGVPGSSKGDSNEFVATGFLYGHFASVDETGKPQYYPYLVTNRHVIDGPSDLLVRLNGLQSPVLWRPDSWSTHPDPEVDVAVAPFHLAAEGFRSWFLSDHHVYFREKLQSVGFMEGDEVYTLGFPLGLAGDERNDVIVRQGVVARIRDWYDGRSDTFLIDALVYPGNSGGPVIAKPTMFSYTETRTHPKLIGMVAGYVPYRDVARSDQTGQVVSVSTENSGLAEVVPIDKIGETIAGLVGAYSGRGRSGGGGG